MSTELRFATREDFAEDVFLAIRELIEHCGITAKGVWQLVNSALKNEPPAYISDRISLQETRSKLAS